MTSVQDNLRNMGPEKELHHKPTISIVVIPHTQPQFFSAIEIHTETSNVYFESKPEITRCSGNTQSDSLKRRRLSLMTSVQDNLRNMGPEKELHHKPTISIVVIPHTQPQFFSAIERHSKFEHVR